MNIQFRIAFIWLMIALCYLFHSNYHLAEAFFGVDIKMKAATGTVPIAMHIFRIVVEVFTMLLALLTLYLNHRGFKVFLFIWAIVLLLLNLVHLGETVYQDLNDISQVGLLSFVVIANSYLVMDTKKWKSIKE